ncbi:MAG: aminotransferase class V-fold PLP-dependent enzyme [Rhodoferax sp.]|nr:aminotransferase class V-fold PLP-dependent enzyme [Rhodoferax sp.]
MKHHFLLDPDVVFLNHGSYGACPRPVFDAWQGWQREMERNPVAFLSRRSAGLLRQARERLSTYLGADAEELVFVSNATTGVNIVAKSLQLQPGDEVLTTDLEYGACRATLAAVCAQAGAQLVVVPVALPLTVDGFVAAMAAAMTPRTRLLMMSHITSPTALRLPIGPVLAQARARGIATLVDGAHAPGQIALDLTALGADFYTGNCHKWMCAPKGTAFLHARSTHHGGLHAMVTSWGEVATDGPSLWDGFIGSSVFERRMQWQGSRDLTGFLSVPAAIDFLAAHDWVARCADCHTGAMALMHRVSARTGIAPIADDAFFVQMAPLPVPHQDAAALRKRLFDTFRIEVPVTQHVGPDGPRTFVRVSVQPYTSDEDLAALEQALFSLL